MEHAETVIFMHGIGGHMEAYARNIVALSARFHTIAYDLLAESQLDKIVATANQLEKVPDMAVLARLLCPTGRKRVATSKSARRQ